MNEIIFWYSMGIVTKTQNFDITERNKNYGCKREKKLRRIFAKSYMHNYRNSFAKD